MTDPELIYILFSSLVTFCLIYPPKEFEGAGLTIPNLFGGYFTDEYTNFIQHHISRTTTTFLVHSSLPLIFLLLGYAQFEANQRTTTVPWSLGVSVSLLLPTAASFVVFHWFQNGWQRHPIAKALQRFSTRDIEWKQIAEHINEDYRSPDRIQTKLNSISSLIITETWIIKTMPFNLKIAKMNETEMIANQADTHLINEFGRDAVQYLNVKITPTIQHNNQQSFTVRLKTADFRSIQEKLTRRIILAPNIRLQPSLMESFIAAFHELIAQNPKYEAQIESDDTCFACMTEVPNIKLKKNCLDIDENGDNLDDEDKCGDCRCRPMWCSSCLARWFAARQDEDHETWLEKKSSCPMCRTKFCVLDVCLIDKNE